MRKLLFAALLLLAGCDDELETIYGLRSGVGAAKSVNGTGVFASMFEQAGHHVSSWKTLSPRLDKADCIVWFPDDFRPPAADVRQWFRDWLGKRPGRTLIYVGRDFDAATWYWKKVRGDAPADQQKKIDARLSAAEERFEKARQEMPATVVSEWYSVERDIKPRAVTDLTGDLEWLEGIDPAKLEIELHSRVMPLGPVDALLESDNDLLIGRGIVRSQPTGESQLFIVANGSFLLNAMLVNHEHRKLAGKLVAAVGPEPREVVFLEARAGSLAVSPRTTPPPESSKSPSQFPWDDRPRRPGEPLKRPAPSGESGNRPSIRDRDPNDGPPNGSELFNHWPTSLILLHLAAVGILLCFWKLPVFGRPLPKDPPGTADFGKHVDAVAELLARSGDRAYAEERVKHYQQLIKPQP